MMLSRTRHQNPLGRIAMVEQIRLQEVSRVLRKIDLSPEDVKDIERLGCTLVDRILLGPVSEAMARLETRSYHEGGPDCNRAIPKNDPSLRGMAHKRRET